ncbi:hypothetical protein ACCO45_001812 [Purpureocillium lilacinum]|uniref:Uncharacterized protein n=1 Tax=Purpureocillium lilacinum TaxID=33203 RepID=A0ACC4EB60_PURLI
MKEEAEGTMTEVTGTPSSNRRRRNMSRLGGDGAAVELTTETIIWVDLHDPINGASFRPSPLKPIPWLTWGGGVEGEAQRNVRSESSEHPTAAVSHQIHGSIEGWEVAPSSLETKKPFVDYQGRGTLAAVTGGRVTAAFGAEPGHISSDEFGRGSHGSGG